ncbi:MAG: collagen-binding domain-containing protein, partial [Pseudolysinimonas sp.]
MFNTHPTSSRAPLRRPFAALSGVVAVVIGFAGLAAVTTLDTASAFTGSNPLSALKNFTVLTQGNATVGNSGEFEGSLAAGGNVSFGQYDLAANQDGSALPNVDGLTGVQLFVGGTMVFPGSGKLDVLSGYARVTDTT